MINENGYITSSFKNTSYTSNGTLYAHWKAKPSVTIPNISQTGYTCSWNTSADGKGTTYNAGNVTDKLNTQTLYAVCKANSYAVSYNSNGGSGTMTNDTTTYNSNFITKKNTFTKIGYTFNGWNEKADGTGTVWGLTTSGVYESGKKWKWTYTKNITLYAQWKANTNTKYVVKHYKQKLDGTYPSEADDTDNLTGTADSSVSPAIKSYAGFTAPSVQTVTIAADGSTVVTYKYTRNKYTFTLGSTTGITTTGSTASGSYYYGSTITLKASANTGYTFNGWISSNTNLVANQTNASATFTMPVGNITMTPSTGYVSYTVTYDATTNGGSTAKQTASTKYKSLVDLTKKAEKSGYEFVGWNTNKDATSALTSYEMPERNVTLYAIYKKTLNATFNYYNSKSETRSVTIYNNATSGSITSPAALGTPSGYTFRHYSTSNVANAAKTIDANSAVVLTGNQTYYASYQKNVTLNFYYHSGTDTYANKQTSTTATGVQYLGYNNAIVNSTVSIPSAVTESTGYYGTSYKGVTAANSTTPISVNTGTANYYAYYQATITYYYYNGSAHTTGAGTRTAYSNGTNYVTTASAAPTPSAYDGATFKGWSITADSINSRTPSATALTVLYAYYQKTVNATFNYYDGSKAASVTAENTRTYISKSGGVNTINTNITIPDAAKASRGSYTYRGISTSNAANASAVTPTTANTTYYSSYTYAITANFTANGGTGTAPSSAAGTGYMNYSGSKIGISVTMPSNTFTRNGYTFGGWYDSVVNKTYTAGTSVTVDSSRNFNATWNVVTYTIKYNLNGGTVSATNPTSYKVTDADITLNNPTKQGYTFTGWTGTGLSEASNAVTIKSESYGNREYTANYSINQYYYDVNPDSGIKSFDITIGGKTSTGLTDYYQKQNYGTEATITNVVAKTGYTYTGYTLGGSMSMLAGSTNSSIKTKLGAGNGAIRLISKANALTFEAQTLASIKYSTTPQALIFKGASNGTGSYSYAITAGNTNSYFTINGTTITTSDTAVPPVGKYKLTVQAIDNTSKLTATAEITIVIEKASSTNPTLTAYSGTYDGQPHTIGVTGGNGGTIQYSTDNKTWSTIKPTRTAQGTTTVYVKVVGDSNHTDTNPISSTITIKPATITYTASSYEGFYDGNSHTISVSVTKPTSGAAITYSTSSNGTYSATKPSYTAAGTYTIYFKIEAANYTTKTDSRTVKINSTNLSGSVTITGTNTWGQTLTANVTNTNSATLSYQWYSTTSTTAIGGTAIADATENTYKIDKSLVGKYIYVVVTASKTNYNKVTWSDITDTTNKTATVAKQALSVTANAATATYDGKEHNATVKVNSASWDGKTIVSGTSTSYGNTVTSAGVTGKTYNLLPSRTAQGTTSISYKITGGSYYNDFKGASSVSINPSSGLSGSVTIKGTNIWGNTLTASVTNTNSATLSYQWYYTTNTTVTGGTAIANATSSTYVIDKSLVGKYIYVVVTASKANYNNTIWNDVTDTATNGSAPVGKRTASISFASSSITINYGESAKNTLTNTGDGTVSYTSSNTGVATINSTTGDLTIKQAGTTTITAKVTDGAYYTYSTKTISYTLTVKKIANTAKVSPVTGIIYGESKAMVSATGIQGTIYYSTETELTEANYLSKGSQDIPSSSGRNAGTYNIYYYVTGNSNYNAASNTSSTPVKTTISPKSIAVTWGTTTFTYNGRAQAPSASATTGVTGETMAVTRTTGTNAGSYTSTASCSSVTGGRAKCSNYTLTGNTKAFSIERASMTAPSSPSDKNYTGKEQVSGITCPTGSTAGGMQKATNAGTYKQTCTPDGNHKWSDGTTTAKSITWTINPKSVAITWGTTTIFTYNGKAQGPSASISTGISTESIILGITAETNAGSYTSTASCGGVNTVLGISGKCSNYTLTGTTKAYTINKQKVSIPTNLNVTTAGIVTWTGVSNATSYQISMDNTNWTAATSGIDYLSSIISSTGTRTIYLRGINSDTTNYETGASANKSISVYTVTAKSGNETMGTVSPTSYKVISGATYSVNSNQLLLKGITSGTTTKTLSTITASPKSGYKFGSWSSTSGTISSDTTITASYGYNSYTVTFNGNSGTVSSSSKTVTYLSQYGTLPTATRADNGSIKYTFEGWYTAATGGTKIESTTTYNTAGNQTLYAHWLSSPIIKGGTSEAWSGSSIEILLDTPSKSDTSDTIKYQYYLSTSQTEQVGGTWIDVTSVDGGVAIYENGKHYIFYRAINVNRDISSVSNYNTLLIDSVTPSVTLSAYHRGNGQKIESDQWTNAGLRFEFGDLTAGPSGATIYYCISDSTSCIPSKVASPNQAVTDSALDNKTGVYKFIYQVSSNAGLDSEIFTYIAKIDTTAPTMKGVIKSLKDSSTLATLTNSSTSYDDSSWKNYGYTIDLSGTTDSESGIAKIEKYTNANNLIRSDTDYKSNLFSGDITSTKTYTEKANGAKYAKYVATDNAGNKATFIVEVLIDTEGPTMKGVVTSLKDSSKLATLTNSSTSYVDSSWKNYGYKITLSGTDSLSGILKITKYTNANNLKKTDSNYKSNLVSGDITSTKTHSESAAGAKYAKFVATDKAGNTTTFTVEVLIDTVAPNPVIKLYKANSDEKKTGSVIRTIDTEVNTAINSWTNYRHYFDLSSSTDSLSGIKEMKMQINRKGINITGNKAEGTTDLVSTYTFTANKYIVAGYSGNRYIRFTITDNAGNSVVRNLRVYIDVEDPILSSISFDSRFSSSTTVSYTCSDSISGFGKFGTTNGMAVNEMMYKNVKSSSSPVTIQCKDTAGNTSTSKTYRWGANSVCGKNSSGGNKTCWHQ